MHDFMNEPDLDLTSKYKKYFDLIDQFLAVYRKFEDGFHNKQLKESQMNEWDFILLTSAPKAIGSVLSIAKLCVHGITDDARSLLRKLLEVSASLLFIGRKDETREQRAKQFYYYLPFKNKKRLNRAKQKPGELGLEVSNELKKIENKILNDYQIAKQHYPRDQRDEVEERFQHNWAGMDFQQILLKSGMQKEIPTYDVLCDASHFSSADIRKYIDFENFVIKTGIEENEVPFILIKSLQYAGQVIDFCDKQFALELSNDLKALMTKIRQCNAELVKESGMSAY